MLKFKTQVFFQANSCSLSQPNTEFGIRYLPGCPLPGLLFFFFPPPTARLLATKG